MPDGADSAIDLASSFGPSLEHSIRSNQHITIITTLSRIEPCTCHVRGLGGRDLLNLASVEMLQSVLMIRRPKDALDDQLMRAPEMSSLFRLFATM